MKTGQVLKVGEKEYTIIVMGDTNGDGDANILDIFAINKHIRRNNTNSEDNLIGAFLIAGDIDGDGDADFLDLLKINKFTRGLISNL